MTKPILVRSAESSDYAAWRPLWDGYNQFYGRHGDTALPEAITEILWHRLLAANEPMFALVALRELKIVGIAHYLFHRSTTRIENLCYLNDIFTPPELRGQGIGRALIDGVYAEALKAGSKRVYWHTQEGNAAGRQLYDKVAKHYGFIVYAMDL
jgi:GNAT superfamily N-acetyltransferase